jgi:hypothetical protein
VEGWSVRADDIVAALPLENAFAHLRPQMIPFYVVSPTERLQLVLTASVVALGVRKTF